jgi:hypothetical protein
MKLWPFANQPSLTTPWILGNDSLKPAADSISLESPSLIILRKYLFYQYMDFAAVPRALRRNLVLQRIRQLSPFGEPAYVEVIEGDSIQVWFWDAGRLQRVLSQQDLPVLEAVPEPLLYPPCQSGLRIQPCLEGWELQYWSNNTLRHSRWLPTAPDSRDQNEFLRVCGASETDAWRTADAQLLRRPWNEKQFWSKEYLLSPQVAPKVIMVVLLVWLFLAAGMWLGSLGKEAVLSRSVASKNAQLINLVRQRDYALQQQEFNQSVLALVNAPSQLRLLAEVQNCLKDLNYSILDWQYQRGQLDLILQQENLDTRVLIESCSKAKVFDEVRAEPGITPNQTRLLFKLVAVKGEENAQ